RGFQPARSALDRLWDEGLRRPSLERRSGGEIERLHHVVGGLAERHGVARRERPEGPGQTDAGRRAQDIGVGDLRRLAGEGGRSLITEDAAGIDKGRGLEAVFVGDPGNAALQFGSGGPVQLPPTLSMVEPGVRSRGPKPFGAKPRTMPGPPKKL